MNVLGVIKTINVFLPLLCKASQTSLAKIIMISSANGSMEFNMKANIDFFVPYAVSKAAINMAMSKYATRFKNENMLFLSLSPGFVATMTDQCALLFALYSAISPLTSCLYIAKDFYEKQGTLFKEAYPDCSGVPMTIEESIAAMLDTVSKLTAADSGKYLTHHGDTTRWL